MNPRERLLTTTEAAAVAHRKPTTIRQWVYRGHLAPFTHDDDGRPLFLEVDVLTAERDTRRRTERNRSLPDDRSSRNVNAPATHMSPNDQIAYAALQSGAIWVEPEAGAIYRKSTGQRCESPQKSGYGRVCVQRTPRSVYAQAHRIVWMSVHGPIPAALQVNHINRRRWDNRIANLELVTPAGNIRHAFGHSYAALTNDDPTGRYLLEPADKEEINPYGTLPPVFTGR